ncbi:hypothetical protein GCM10009839_08150 [Catenulispora yoronensis]|uniref:Uncharacterized protein n=1 Tax=Catenulispora yoronensis TaxID=450799 RepID=A0ABP5F6M1_9ACTN
MNEIPPAILPGTAALLAERPPTAPNGAWVVADGGVPTASVKRDDWIAVGRRWRRVTLCTEINGAVEITTDPKSDLPPLPGSRLVHIARPISCEAVAAAQLLGYGVYAKDGNDRRSKL